jgi:hypothetical protein
MDPRSQVGKLFESIEMFVHQKRSLRSPTKQKPSVCWGQTPGSRCPRDRVYYISSVLEISESFPKEELHALRRTGRN